MSVSTGVAVGAAVAAANASDGASSLGELTQGGAALLLAMLVVSVAVGAIVGRANYASDRDLGLAMIYGAVTFVAAGLVLALLLMFAFLLTKALGIG